MTQRSPSYRSLLVCVLLIVVAGAAVLVNMHPDRNLATWDGQKAIRGSTTLQPIAPQPAPTAQPALAPPPLSTADAQPLPSAEALSPERSPERHAGQADQAPTAGAQASAAAFTLEISPELYVGQADQLRAASLQAYEEVVARVNKGRPATIHAEILLDYSCALRGVAHPDFRAVQVYSCDSIDSARTITILAHEFVHQIAYDYYGAAAEGRADAILAEGLATWGAGRYWLGGHPSFRAFVRGQRGAGVAYPLATSHYGEDFSVMNALYYQWASFVEFLIEHPGYGPKFDALYRTGSGGVGSADYAGVLGSGLSGLEQEWLTWLERG